jgi:hypothetical protein
VEATGIAVPPHILFQHTSHIGGVAPPANLRFPKLLVGDESSLESMSAIAGAEVIKASLFHDNSLRTVFTVIHQAETLRLEVGAKLRGIEVGWIFRMQM